jgi:hypothetical protein
LPPNFDEAALFSAEKNAGADGLFFSIFKVHADA